MLESQAKKEYDALLESGELNTVFGGTGDWDTDKKSFIRYYEKNQQIISDGLNLHKLLEDDDDDFLEEPFY